MNHTPTPWKAFGGVINDAKNRTVARAGCLADLDETDANAEFIVKACNCHEELLAACKRALLAFEAMPPRLNEDRYEPLMALKSAIAKANA